MTDAPCANLAEELVKAYPNAKVVLNTRHVDKWLASMETSYYDILAWRSLQMLAAVDSVRLFFKLFSFCLFPLLFFARTEMFVYTRNIKRVLFSSRPTDGFLHLLSLIKYVIRTALANTWPSFDVS